MIGWRLRNFAFQLDTIHRLCDGGTVVPLDLLIVHHFCEIFELHLGDNGKVGI